MARAGRVRYDDRLSVVEHLTELRRRLITCLLVFGVVFAGCWVFNDEVIGVVNEPLTRSQAPDCRGVQRDPLAQSTCFQRDVGVALGALGPALRDVRAQLQRDAGRAAGPQRRELRQRLERLDRAVERTRQAARGAPTSVSRNPVTLGVAEPFFQTFTVSAYAALVLSLPLLLWQLYAFLIPAFSPTERRVAIPLLWMVPVLFYAGVVFAYLLALPRAVDFLQNFNDDNFDILVQAREYYRFTAVFLGGVGVLFQVPVVVLGISRMGILSARDMRARRGVVILIITVLAAIVTPTPDPVTLLIAAAPLLLLFEGSVALAALFERRWPVAPRWDLDEWGSAAERAGREVGQAWEDAFGEDEEGDEDDDEDLGDDEDDEHDDDGDAGRDGRRLLPADGRAEEPGDGAPGAGPGPRYVQAPPPGAVPHLDDPRRVGPEPGEPRPDAPPLLPPGVAVDLEDPDEEVPGPAAAGSHAPSPAAGASVGGHGGARHERGGVGVGTDREPGPARRAADPFTG